jgi:hypothetical protein
MHHVTNSQEWHLPFFTADSFAKLFNSTWPDVNYRSGNFDYSFYGDLSAS